MMRWSLLRYLLLIFLVLLWSRQPVLAQDTETRLAITSPTSGEAVSGVVPIIGSAAHPTQFAAYQLWFALSGSDRWFPITGPIQQQVEAGLLGQWDTTELPASHYQIRLQIVFTDSTTADVLVDNVIIQPAIVPTQSTLTPPSANPTAATNPPGASTPSSSESPILIENSSATTNSTPNLGSAFCVGAAIGAGLIALVGAYTFMRKQLRTTIRRTLSRLDEE